jgi:membrane associated rhomboid family serine protease
MRYGTPAYAQFGFGRPWTPAARALILACGGVYLVQIAFGRSLPLVGLFALDTSRPLEVWRWVTYAFLHGGPFHLFFNALGIWMFGSDVEERLGSRKFSALCAATGIGAALSVLSVDRLLGRESIVLGSSGIVFGLLLAYGVLFSERVVTLLLFFVLPVSLKAKHLVVAFGAIELLFGMSGGSRTSHVAHLGGMLFGWLVLRAPAGTPRPERDGAGLFKPLRDRLAGFTRARDDRRMDALLQKVNDRGIGSLSDAEKKFLHRISRRKRWQ